MKEGVEARARCYTDVALKGLVAIAKNGKSEAAIVSACMGLLDRGYGRPRQALEHSGRDGGPIEVSGDELRARLASRIAGTASRIGTPGGHS